MSDTTSDAVTGADDRISLSKATPAQGATAQRRPGLFGRPAPASREPVENVTVPLTVQIVTGALVVVVICQILTALLFRLPGYVDQLTGVLAKSNADAKNPKPFFDSLDSLHTVRTSYAIQAGVIGVALLLLAWAMRRTRSASGSRWALLIIVVFTGSYDTIIPGKGLPGPIQVVGVISGAAAIIALLLTFIPPPSQRYFRACKLASTPEHLRGKPRAGLGSLFGPKRPRGGADAASGGAAARGGAGRRPAATRTANGPTAAKAPAAGKARAKVRSDGDAIARGAELARSRAKASKSRRTD